MSKRSAALVGAAGMNDRKRGLSQDTTAVANSSTKSRRTSAASLPSGRISPVSDGAESRRLAPEVEWHRIEGQSLLAIGHHEVGHALVVLEHALRGHGAASFPPAGRFGIAAVAPPPLPLRPARPPRGRRHPSSTRSAPRRRIRAWPDRDRPSCARSCRRWTPRRRNGRRASARPPWPAPRRCRSWSA